MTNLLFVLLAASANLTFPQKHVLCLWVWDGCRVKEQVSLPTRMPDGWLKVKVRHRIWVQKWDRETTPVECVDEPASGRAGPPVQDLWLFANCSEERFAVSKNPDRHDAWEQDVFYRKGELAGYPKYGTSWKLFEMGIMSLKRGEGSAYPEATAVLQRFFYKEQ